VILKSSLTINFAFVIFLRLVVDRASIHPFNITTSGFRKLYAPLKMSKLLQICATKAAFYRQRVWILRPVPAGTSKTMPVVRERPWVKAVRTEASAVRESAKGHLMAEYARLLRLALQLIKRRSRDLHPSLHLFRSFRAIPCKLQSLRNRPPTARVTTKKEERSIICATDVRATKKCAPGTLYSILRFMAACDSDRDATSARYLLYHYYTTVLFACAYFHKI